MQLKPVQLESRLKAGAIAPTQPQPGKYPTAQPAVVVNPGGTTTLPVQEPPTQVVVPLPLPLLLPTTVPTGGREKLVGAVMVLPVMATTLTT